MPTTIIQPGQVSAPQSLAPGVLVTVTPGSGASAFVEYTTGSPIDLVNGTATWSPWPRGTVSSTAAALANKQGFVRVTATGGSVVLDVNFYPTNQQLAPYATDWNGQKALSVQAQSAVSASVTGTATETTLATVALPANAVAINGRLRLRSYFSVTSNTDTKTLRVRIGSAIVTLGVINGAGTYVILDADLMNVGGGQIAYVQSWIGANSYPGVVASTGGLASVDLTQAQSLTITGQLGTTTDTIQLLGYSVEVLNP